MLNLNINIIKVPGMVAMFSKDRRREGGRGPWPRWRSRSCRGVSLTWPALWTAAALVSCAGADGAPPASEPVREGPALGESPEYVASTSFINPGDVWSTYTAVAPGVDDKLDSALRSGLETNANVGASTHAGDIFV